MYSDVMSTKKPQEPAEDGSEQPGEPTEITLRDGESVTFSAPDGAAHIVVNIAPPERSTGFFSSCLQGCGCLVLVLVIIGLVGSLIR